MATSLLDLPDELLIRCLAGSGGLGIGAASAACTRLHGLGCRLRRLSVFSSAVSTQPSLQHAIRDAGQRALSACFGAVDFALLFVANYGNARGKKYSDPTDLGHAVEMLREVLGQDVVIVGCACAGLMGVGPDSLPVEVDPLSNMSRGRAAAAARRKAGLAAPPTKGVAVLLGKLPPGCVARAFAQESMEGPPAPTDPHLPPSAWAWPCLEEALALTSSQKAALAQQLTAGAPAAATGPGSNSHPGQPSSSGVLPDNPAPTADSAHSPADRVPQAAAAAVELGASPETAAAAEGLLSVVAAAAAAVAEQPQGEGGRRGGCGEVELVPRLCLLLYDNSLQSFGYTESAEMERALQHLAARGVLLVGGASSGAGDIFFSPGAEGRRVMVGEPPASPQIVGLMLCTARAPAAAEAATAAAPAGPLEAAAANKQAPATPAEPAAAGPLSKAGASRAAAQSIAAPRSEVWADSAAALQAATLAALGLGPSEPGAPLFAALRAKLAASHALSVNHLAVQLEVEGCLPVPAAAALPPAQAAAAELQPAGADAPAGAADGPACSADAPAAAAAAANAAAGAPASSVRRSARLQSAAAHPAAASTAALTPLQQLHASISAGTPVASFDDDEDDEGQYLAVWACPPGKTPAAFTGEEGQVAVCELLACELKSRHGPTNASDATSGSSSSSSGEYVEVTAAIHVSGYAALKEVLTQAQPGSSLCCQVVGTKGPACAATLRRSVAQLLPMVRHSPAPPASCGTNGSPPPAAGPAAAGAAAGGMQPAVVGGARRAMQDCYDALARCAADSGARSGLQGLAVCSCTGRGQQLYAAPGDPAAFGEVSEARIIDGVAGGSVPFVGVYVSGELGPEVQHMSTGWGRPAGGDVGGGGGEAAVAEMQGFTSMVAAWGCQPGVA